MPPTLCSAGDSRGDTCSGHTIGWAVFRAHDLEKGDTANLTSIPAPQKVQIDPEPHPGAPTHGSRGLQEGVAEHDVIRGRAVGGHPVPPQHHPPSARAPRGAHPLSLRVPRAVQQRTAAAPFYFQPHREAWEVPGSAFGKTRRSPAPVPHPAVKSPQELGEGRLGIAGMSRTPPVLLPAGSTELERGWAGPPTPKNSGFRMGKV